MVHDVGGVGIAIQVDHSRPPQVAELMEQIFREQGRLDVVVNDIWGGDGFIDWGQRFWEHPLDDGIQAIRQSLETHLITSRYAAPLMVRRGSGLLIEVTDGTGVEGYRGNVYYDLAKHAVVRLAEGEAADLAGTGVTVVCLTPGFLRSEAVLDTFGVTESNWQEAISDDKWTHTGHLGMSESPSYIGRAVVALASDPGVARYHGSALTTGFLASRYGFTDADGTRPDFWTYFSGFLKEEGIDFVAYVDRMTGRRTGESESGTA